MGDGRWETRIAFLEGCDLCKWGSNLLAYGHNERLCLSIYRRFTSVKKKKSKPYLTFVKFTLHLSSKLYKNIKMKRTSTLDQKRQANVKRLAAWTISWTLSQALVTFGGQLLWPHSKPAIIITLIINVLLGIGVISANRRYLMEGDELDKKVQLESMSLALGLSIVMGLAYASMDHTNLIAFDADISHLVIFTALSYITALFINRKRYL